MERVGLSQTERVGETDTERDVRVCVCAHGWHSEACVTASGMCVVPAELLLVFIHREADVSPAEGQQGSSGTGGRSARQPRATPQTFADLNTQHMRLITATFQINS